MANTLQLHILWDDDRKKWQVKRGRKNGQRVSRWLSTKSEAVQYAKTWKKGVLVLYKKNGDFQYKEPFGVRQKKYSKKSIQEPREKRIFIVHGHDDKTKQTVARFLEHLNLTPIILHEQPNKGRTIIEKFEDYSNVGFAVVILTPDDLGSSAKPSEIRPRARQNVILELGFFIGKLGRDRVCPLYIGNLELPSDYSGVIYIPLDSVGEWRIKLANEIKEAGIDVDLNKAI
jgi:predicted nucleotide-binding protein